MSLYNLPFTRCYGHALASFSLSSFVVDVVSCPLSTLCQTLLIAMLSRARRLVQANVLITSCINSRFTFDSFRIFDSGLIHKRVLLLYSITECTSSFLFLSLWGQSFMYLWICTLLTADPHGSQPVHYNRLRNGHVGMQGRGESEVGLPHGTLKPILVLRHESFTRVPCSRSVFI